jgi:hypothetical protein
MATTLLLTTALNPPKGVHVLKLSDYESRFLLTKASAFFWSMAGIEKLVICDSTGALLLSDEEFLMIEKLGIQVEQICFKQDEKLIRQRGKGFAEGQLINFAINNSKTLKNVETFYKCTGKVYCCNFKSIDHLIKSHRIKNIFWGSDNPAFVDPRFFYITKEYFITQVYACYQKAYDSKNQIIEELLFQDLSTDLAPHHSLMPLLSGFSGGTGLHYLDNQSHFPQTSISFIEYF